MAIRDPLGPVAPDHQLTEAQVLLGHRFASPALLREALTHRSAAGDAGAGSNERLEFMGDRVLGLLIAEWLAERYPHEQEGALGRRLAHLVSQPVLAGLAADIGLPALLDVAPGEGRAGVRRRATVAGDLMEAVIGALYLDGGLDAARRFVRRVWGDSVGIQFSPPKDAKTALQEWGHAHGGTLPSYEIVAREGPAHAPSFTVAVSLGEHSASATAASKRAAEKAAAAALLERLA